MLHVFCLFCNMFILGSAINLKLNLKDLNLSLSDVVESLIDVVESLVNSVPEVSEEAIMTEEEPFKIVDIDDPDDMEHENDVSNPTFLNPSQNDKLPSAENFKCKLCNFSSTRKTCKNDHKEEI